MTLPVADTCRSTAGSPLCWTCGTSAIQALSVPGSAAIELTVACSAPSGKSVSSSGMTCVPRGLDGPINCAPAAFVAAHDRDGRRFRFIRRFVARPRPTGLLRRPERCRKSSVGLEEGQPFPLRMWAARLRVRCDARAAVPVAEERSPAASLTLSYMCPPSRRMSSTACPSAGYGSGFQRAAVPVQLKRADLGRFERVAGEPAVGGDDSGRRRRKATRRVHRLIGVGLEGGVCVGGHHPAAGEVTERVVLQWRGLVDVFSGFAGLAGASVGDGPEFAGAGPGDASVGGAADGGELMPIDAVVGPHARRDRRWVAGGDQQPPVGRRELDVADVAEADRDPAIPGRPRATWGGSAVPAATPLLPRTRGAASVRREDERRAQAPARRVRTRLRRRHRRLASIAVLALDERALDREAFALRTKRRR